MTTKNDTNNLEFDNFCKEAMKEINARFNKKYHLGFYDHGEKRGDYFKNLLNERFIFFQNVTNGFFNPKKFDDDMKSMNYEDYLSKNLRWEDKTSTEKRDTENYINKKI